MSTYTVLISRNLSAVEGKPNGKAVANVRELCPGDLVSDWDARAAMKDIFYWKTVELTDQQRDDINEAITSPHWDDGDPAIIYYPAKKVDLDCFNAGEITTLAARGPIAAGLGGTITNSNFIITIL